MKRKRLTDFLGWAKRQGGECCEILCTNPAEELHHWESAGMARKGSDLFVCRLCRECHTKAKKSTALKLRGEWDTLCAYQADSLSLIRRYIEG